MGGGGGSMTIFDTIIYMQLNIFRQAHWFDQEITYSSLRQPYLHYRHIPFGTRC